MRIAPGGYSLWNLLNSLDIWQVRCEVAPQTSSFSAPSLLGFTFFKNVYLFLRERKRERERDRQTDRQGREGREGDRESKAGSALLT